MKDQEFEIIEFPNDLDFPKDNAPSSRILSNNLEHLSVEQRVQLFNIIDKFPNVFSDSLEICPILSPEINISPDFSPKRLKAYKIPQLPKKVSKQINVMLQQGVIVPSQSPMVSPVVCVLKALRGETGVRLAIDFRHVNKFTKGDCFPIPDIPDVLQKVGRAHYIS